MAIKQQKFDPIEDATFQVANKNRGWSQKAREGSEAAFDYGYAKP